MTQGAYLGQGTYFFFEKQPNVQNKTLIQNLSISETISDSAECNLRLDREVTQILAPTFLSLGSQLGLFPFAEYERTKT